MTSSIALLLGLLFVAIVVLAREWLPVDIVTLLLISALVLSGVLTPLEAFSGFANEIIVILGSIFVLSGALTRTRVLDWLGEVLARFGGDSPSRILLLLTSISASVSAFLNNTNTTAVLMPATFELSRRSSVSPSRLLMPLAYASIFGGACTLIGTSTNVAASGLMVRLGLEPFSVFEFSPIGVPLALVGILYMSLVGWRFLPGKASEELSAKYEIAQYLAEIVVEPESRVVGKTIGDSGLGRMELNVLTLVREGTKRFPWPEIRLEVGDLLVVLGSREALIKAKEDPGLRFEADENLGDSEIADDELELSEAIVMPQSQLVGHTLRDLHFRQRFGLAVLALYRKSQLGPRDLRDLRLHVGDVLLLEGPRSRLTELEGSRDLLVLGEVDHIPGRRKKGLWALGALLAAIVAGATGIAPLSISLLLAAVLVVLLGVVPGEEVYTLIEWRLLILIGGMTSVGLAMQKTGAAEWIAQHIVELALPFGLTAVLATFAVLAMVLTQPLSNAAAALVLLPVAISTAESLAVSPRPFAVMVTLAASLSFLTPFEPACLLVYGPGRYRFVDFVKSGFVLSVLSLAVLLIMVPRLWPL